MNALVRTLRFLGLFLLLLGIWLLLSGKFDAFHVGWGVVGSAVVAWLAFRARPSVFPVFRFLAFIPWELGQILISNLRVAKAVLQKDCPIQPRLLRRDPGLSDHRALTLLGASITLTPGTLTVDIDEGQMIVHALDDASAQDIHEGVMAERVRRVFQEPAS